jgi:hypothetical protein
MGNVAHDIVNDINLTPEKSKLLNKILLAVLIPLISAAFVYGGFRMSRANKMSNLEKADIVINKRIDETNKSIDLVKEDIDLFKDNVKLRFIQYQNYNAKQLGLIIDYRNSNPDLLKRMLELNSVAFALELMSDTIKINKR